MRRSRLHVTGASGTGTTTLGRAVAAVWSFPHADTDDFFWKPTNPPFTRKRPELERTALMRQIFVPREAWVLSGSMLGWGRAVLDECDAVVFLTLEADTRLQRLEQRERMRGEGRPVDDTALDKFLDWARQYDRPDFSGRSLAGHESWLTTLDCPVLRLESSGSVESLRDDVLGWTVSQ